MKLKKQAVKTYFNSDDYQRLINEAHVRETNFSQTIQDCLNEYLALRRELATAIELPDELGTEHTGKIFIPC